MKIVLLADDTPVIRKVGTRLLEDLGFVVMQASDGREALALCRDNMPDAAIIDWDMPDMAGIDVIGEIARLPEAIDTKLIYCTSETLVSEMMRAKRAGASAFLLKPFNRALLAQKLEETGLLAETGVAA